MYASRHMRRTFVLLSCCFALLSSPLAASAQGGADNGHPNDPPETDRFAVAQVIAIEGEHPDTFAGVDRIVQNLKLRVITGPDTGKEWTVENGILGGRKDMEYAVGDKVTVEMLTKIDGSVSFILREKYRLPSLGWLLVAFIALAVLCGGMTALSSIAGLLVSIGVLALVLVPRITAGGDPLFWSLLCSVVIACTSLYIAHGFNRRTTVSLIATLVTLALAAVAAILAVRLTSLFGVGTEEAFLLQTGPLEGMNFRGLLLGGILIGTLGVLDDVTTAQVASVAEVARHNPRLNFQQLFLSGTRVGREHIASLINTLALAYVGASLPLLLLFKTNDTWPFWVTLNSEFLAEEIVRTLVGSATLLLAVPISTWLASYEFQGGKHADAGHFHVH